MSVFWGGTEAESSPRAKGGGEPRTGHEAGIGLGAYVPHKVRWLWDLVMGGRGRLRASSRAVFGDSESAELRRRVGRGPSERMAVSLRMTVGLTLHQVSTRLPTSGSVCMAVSALPPAQPPDNRALQAQGPHPGGRRAESPSPQPSCRGRWRHRRRRWSCSLRLGTAAAAPRGSLRAVGKAGPSQGQAVGFRALPRCGQAWAGKGKGGVGWQPRLVVQALGNWLLSSPATDLLRDPGQVTSSEPRGA